MDDFISLAGNKQKVEEFDILKLTPDPPDHVTFLPKSTPQPVQNKPSAEQVKPFYPTCKRVLTRAPFWKKSVTNGLLNPQKLPDKTENERKPSCTARSTPPTSPPLKSAASSCSVGKISLDELMSVDDERRSPEKRLKTLPTAVETDERVVRLRHMLKQAEAEKSTLQGYVADLQAKLAAVPKRQGVKSCESQTDENGRIYQHSMCYRFISLSSLVTVRNLVHVLARRIISYISLMSCVYQVILL